MWKPMQSAKQDGSEILVNTEHGHYFVVYWCGDDWFVRVRKGASYRLMDRPTQWKEIDK